MGSRRALALLAAVACCLGGAVLEASGANATPAEGIHNIRHVVMIMQENRSFDNYFGTYPGVNGIPAGVCEKDPVNGECDKPFHDPANRNFGGNHGFTAAINDIDRGAMDGFVTTYVKANHCTKGKPTCLPCTQQELEHEEENFVRCDDVMGYHDARELPNYWTYAKDFVLQDDMFESALSWSAPEHNYMVSGWSANCPGGNTNPMACTNDILHTGNNRAWTDVTYLLHKAGVSWAYYLFEGTEPDCEFDEALECAPVGQHLSTPGIWNPLSYFDDVKEDGQREDIQSLTNFYKAVHAESQCGLPNVSWVMPTLRVSEHPRNMITAGQTYVTTLVNSIMRSPCWGSTAIFLSWDDWGGFYDNARPPSIDENGFGLRVPGLTISPYARAGYIDHQALSHDAYLKFIEDDFLGGARLNPATDGRPDKRPDVREEAAGLGNLLSEFDFAQAPRAPILLAAHPSPGPASSSPGSQRPPALETAPPTFVTGSSATLNATVNPDGGAVGECLFEYGPTSAYGSSAPCASAPGEGGSPVAVSAAVHGLQSGGGYHFRIVAANAAGRVQGPDLTFTTTSAASSVESGEAAAVASQDQLPLPHRRHQRRRHEPRLRT